MPSVVLNLSKISILVNGNHHMQCDNAQMDIFILILSPYYFKVESSNQASNGSSSETFAVWII